MIDRELPRDATRFDAVLDELRMLMKEFVAIGVHVVLVGGQVLGIEQKESGGTGDIEVRTPTGVVVTRGFSLEPDLLLDVDEAANRVDAVGDALRRCDFQRVKTGRWLKHTHVGEMFVDIFIPAEADERNDPGAVRLPHGETALSRPRKVLLHLPRGILEIDVPGPVGFLAMKLEAKLRLRPKETRDSFDMYAYVAMKGASFVAQAIREDRVIGAGIQARLQSLFGAIDSQGVADVLSFAAELSADEQELLGRAVVDLMAEITG